MKNGIKGRRHAGLGPNHGLPTPASVFPAVAKCAAATCRKMPRHNLGDVGVPFILCVARYRKLDVTQKKDMREGFLALTLRMRPSHHSPRPHLPFTPSIQKRPP